MTPAEAAAIVAAARAAARAEAAGVDTSREVDTSQTVALPPLSWDTSKTVALPPLSPDYIPPEFRGTESDRPNQTAARAASATRKSEPIAPTELSGTMDLSKTMVLPPLSPDYIPPEFRDAEREAATQAAARLESTARKVGAAEASESSRTFDLSKTVALPPLSPDYIPPEFRNDRHANVPLANDGAATQATERALTPPPLAPANPMWPMEGKVPPRASNSTASSAQAQPSKPALAPAKPSKPTFDFTIEPSKTDPSNTAAPQQQSNTSDPIIIASQPAFRHDTVTVGTYPDPTSILTRDTVQSAPMHVNWGDVRLDELPKVPRLEPIHPRRWPWVVMGLAAGAAAAIYFWLPRFDTTELPPEVAAVVEPLKTAIASNSSTEANPTSGNPAPDASATATTLATPVTTSAVNPTQPFTAAEEQRLRQMRQLFDDRLAALEARGAGVWGGREFAMAKTRAAESVGAHDAGNPRLSQERLTAASKFLDTVEARAPQALSTQVAAGEQALNAGQQEVAGQAFDLAHRINPGDRRAVDGQRRAQNLPAVLPLLADAQNAEADHDYARAAQDYSQALSLDPNNAAAKAGQARANAAFGDDNYAKAIGTGFAALGAGRLDEAHDAFVKAKALNPKGAEASEGSRRVGAALTARGFASMRQRAASLENQERWDEAERTYEDVLAADSSLAFAQEGKARTTSRADLSLRLQQLIDRPDRLNAPGVKDDAQALLETAKAQSPQGPVIRSQIARLESLLPGADRPVRLSLVSDNSTQVVISSIGAFGAFSRREIQLRPGKYTVTGTRNGFRDVRREITVAPGQDALTIRVTCSEPI